MIESTAVSMTAYLLNELMKRKIKVIFCNEKRQPAGELIPYYGSHDSSRKIYEQINFNEYVMDDVWREIIKEKILNQAKLLARLELKDRQLQLETLAQEIEPVIRQIEKDKRQKCISTVCLAQISHGEKIRAEMRL